MPALLATPRRHAQAIEQQSELPDAGRASGATVAGLAYENLNQYPEAIEHFKRATELAPEREDPYLYLARVYGKKHNFPAMVAILEQARKQITGSLKIELALGDGLVSVERYAEAIQILTEVVRNSPDEVEAYPNLAEAYRNTGQPKLATDTLRKLALRKPDYPMLHLVIARSISQEDPVDSAAVLEELDLAEKAAPDDYEVYYLRGKVYLGMNKFRRPSGVCCAPSNCGQRIRAPTTSSASRTASRDKPPSPGGSLRP